MNELNKAVFFPVVLMNVFTGESSAVWLNKNSLRSQRLCFGLINPGHLHQVIIHAKIRLKEHLDDTFAVRKMLS